MPSPEPNGGDERTLVLDVTERTLQVIQVALLRDLHQLLTGAVDEVCELIDSPQHLDKWPANYDTLSHFEWLDETLTALKNVGWTKPAVVDRQEARERAAGLNAEEDR